ncbi:hypothetical protein Tco_1107479 [Tanacetum coccineum]
MAADMKHMVTNFSKLDKFEGFDFRRWQIKMHFLLSTMSVVCVLNTPIPDDGDDAIVEQIRRMKKWENDDYMCRAIILNGMSDSLFQAYLKHKKEELTLVELGNHLRIEESLRVQDNDKPKGNNVAGLSVVNMVEHNNSIRIPNETKDIDGLVVLEEVTKEVVTQQPEPETRKGKSNRTPKNFGPEFQLYLIEGTMDEVSNQPSYFFNVEDGPKTFDEAMKS